MTDYLNETPIVANPGSAGGSSVSGSNLKSMIQALQGNSMQQPQNQQQPLGMGGGLNAFNQSFGKQVFDNSMTNPAPTAQQGLNQANSMFGTYDPAQQGLSNANDMFGTYNGGG